MARPKSHVRCCELMHESARSDVACFTCAESGRTDVESTKNDFIFTPANKSAFESFNSVDDSVLEFDELLIATFDLGPEIANNLNVRKGTPSTTYILIRDDDCE